MNCKNCGAQLDESYTFCNQCGNAVEQNSKNGNGSSNEPQVSNQTYNNNVEQHSNQQYYNNNANNSKIIILAIILVILFFVGGLLIGKSISRNNINNKTFSYQILNLNKEDTKFRELPLA